MQIFIDSADPQEISQAFDWGIVDGVTTNPSLAARVGKPYSEIVQEILGTMHEDATISLEVVATDLEGMLAQARALAKLDDRVVVKLPCIWEGIKATKILGNEGILVNVTLVFSVSQAVLAAKAGAFYISPFVGRLNDQRHGHGDKVVEDIAQVLNTYEYQSQLLYASVRNLKAVEHAATIGADIVTVPFGILSQMIQHDQTDQGLQKFVSDWKTAGLSLPA